MGQCRNPVGVATNIATPPKVAEDGNLGLRDAIRSGLQVTSSALPAAAAENKTIVVAVRTAGIAGGAQSTGANRALDLREDFVKPVVVRIVVRARLES